MIRNYFNSILSAALFIACFTSLDTASAQIGDGDYVIVRFVIDGLQDNAHAYELDEQLRTHPDVLMSRSDFNTKNYLGFFSTDTQLDAQELKTMLANLSLDLRCYVVVPNDGTLFNKLDPNGCDAALPDLDEAE